MGILFLALLFVSFISLGLPDTGLGIVWPFMRGELNLDVEFAGVISIVATASAMVSSLLNGKISAKIGTNKVTAFSCLITALGMFLYTQATSWVGLIVAAIPCGIGGGAVDAGLNSYVAKHYNNRIMSWLHAFWGVGATLSPIVITAAIVNLGSWRYGYWVVIIFQLALAVILFASLKLWSNRKVVETTNKRYNKLALNVTVKSGSVWLSIASFLFYVGIETTLGLWLNTLLVEGRGYDAALGGTTVALYFGAIMVGRFLVGILSKIGSRNLIRIGLGILTVGIGLLFVQNVYVSFASVMLIGLGLSPVYPSLMHEAGVRFDDKCASKVIGYQTAGAYLGMVSISPLVGVLSSALSLEVVVFAVAIFAVMLIVVTECLNKLTPVEMSLDNVEIS